MEQTRRLITCGWEHPDCTAYWDECCTALTSCNFPGKEECPFYKTKAQTVEQYKRVYGENVSEWPPSAKKFLTKKDYLEMCNGEG